MNIHAPKQQSAAAPLVDPFGRAITYVRVSVTDRCDFRCVYCMSEDMTFLPKRDLLTLEELDRMCSAFVARGTRKLRSSSVSARRWRCVLCLLKCPLKSTLKCPLKCPLSAYQLPC